MFGHEEVLLRGCAFEGKHFQQKDEGIVFRYAVFVCEEDIAERLKVRTQNTAEQQCRMKNSILFIPFISASFACQHLHIDEVHDLRAIKQPQ